MNDEFERTYKEIVRRDLLVLIASKERFNHNMPLEAQSLQL
jgi:hypothetical protein